MSEAVSLERRQILAALGADFLRTPAQLGTDGAIEAVYRLQRRDPGKYYIPDQYNNPANPLAHYNGTALEIWEQTRRPDHASCCHHRNLRHADGHEPPAQRTQAGSPDHWSGTVSGHKIQGLKNMKEAYRPGIFDRKPGREGEYQGRGCIRNLSPSRPGRGLVRGDEFRRGGLCCPAVGKRIARGVIVVMLPDGGERYLSTTLFRTSASVAGMNRSSSSMTRLPGRSGCSSLWSRESIMYSCGPTVNAEPTLGLLRRVIVADILRRYLEYSGFEVRHVMNVTDLDDNTIQESIKRGISLKELTDRYVIEFMECLDQLVVKHAWKYPRTSEHIDDMAVFTRQLINKGFAYERLRSVYFDIGKFPKYGALSGLDLSKIKVGATVDLDEYDKEDPRDFTLFKRATLAEMARDIFYETDWGNVRPSWHVQCAAMSTRFLGEEFDIHTSGTDILFPHNENEIAQCASLHGKGPARYWVHSELVLAGGKKMSRSGGNAVTIKDVLNLGYSAREVRYLLLSTHYRQPVTYSEEKLQTARASLRRIDAFVGKLRRCAEGRESDLIRGLVEEMLASFKAAMESDLNVPMALGAVFIMIRTANPHFAKGEISKSDAALIFDALEKIHSVLAVFDFNAACADTEDPEIEAKVSLREDARERKDYEEADRIREDLRRRNVVIEDTAYGAVYWIENRAPKN